MTDTQQPEYTEKQTEVTVRLERQVRIGRLLIFGIVLGALAGVLLTIAFPVVPEGFYTLGQMVGFMAVLGAGIGLLLAGVIVLFMVRAVRKKQGRAQAIQSSVQ